MTYTEEAPENDSTTLSEATETIDKQIDTEKKWWQLWKINWRETFMTRKNLLFRFYFTRNSRIQSDVIVSDQ